MEQSNIINIAKTSIQLQTKSIEALTNYIDANFEQAVHAIHRCVGRIVITGIGKSAIIAQKIVATLNSTGTPSLFMHAADAIHGDLGMIQRDDIVIVISKSGESPEIKTLIPLIQSTQNTCIAIVGNLNSYLAQQANYVLNASVNQEACPNNLAPTSSTTAQLVLGDAIAICLMNLNNFTEINFAKFHPGGNLGKRLLYRVVDLYTTNPKPKVFLQTSIKDVIIEITKNRLGATAVVDENQIVLGVITDGDIRRMLEKNDNLSNIIAADIYTPNCKTIESNKMALEALPIFKTNNISQVIVVEGNIYKGFIHLHDLIREGII